MNLNGKQLPLVLVVWVLLAASAFGSTNYDGKWWLSINQRQRGGFIRGFAVCYAHFANPQLLHEGIPVYSARLTEYLRAHPESLPGPVEGTLLTIASPPYAESAHRPSKSNETPEEAAAPWGAHNDGDEWRGPDSFNLGYIQGFLECYSKYAQAKYGTFSKPPEWYVDAIAGWYGTKADDPDAINPAREHEKIPEVLFRFRDRAQGE